MKGLDTKLFLKALSPQMLGKILATFDRVTALIVALCWAAAALMIGFSLYTVNMTVKAKSEADAATAAEPVLPRIVRNPVGTKDVQPIIDRLEKRYPNIKLVFKGTLTVSGSTGADFHDWLASLDYLETVAPQIRWTVQELCVGKCSGKDLMSASLSGEKISFEKPQGDEK